VLTNILIFPETKKLNQTEINDLKSNSALKKKKNYIALIRKFHEIYINLYEH